MYEFAGFICKIAQKYKKIPTYTRKNVKLFLNYYAKPNPKQKK